MTHLCRFCATPLTQSFCDLGETPLANSYVEPGQEAQERRFALHARVCSQCFLVQVEDSVPPDAIFSDYAYFSSYSDSWVAHARAYADAMTRRFNLGPHSLVVEVASNDGYLLQHFKAAGVPVLGVEPAANVAEVARAKGIATEVAFFGGETARRLTAAGHKANLMAANNVLAHVPDIEDFVSGFTELLADDGVITFEFPHVLNLIREIQFDTIYHEHFSYLSLTTVEKVLAKCGLKVVDVDDLPTHGGSLRLYCAHVRGPHSEAPAVSALRARERAAKLDQAAGYAGFQARVNAVREEFLRYVADSLQQGRRIAAYGAAAKGNTFLNFCGITSSQIACCYDRSRAKQGKLTPGSHIPILDPSAISQSPPDDVLILPWNLAREIVDQMRPIVPAGTRFVSAIPKLAVRT